MVITCKVINLIDIIPGTKVHYNMGHLMTSAFLTLTKGQGHTRSKVTDVELSAFSECFFFFFSFFILIIWAIVNIIVYIGTRMPEQLTRMPVDQMVQGSIPGSSLLQQQQQYSNKRTAVLALSRQALCYVLFPLLSNLQRCGVHPHLKYNFIHHNHKIFLFCSLLYLIYF